jgi:hypothetical protein
MRSRCGALVLTTLAMVAGSARLESQAMLLQLRPRVGDTLSIHMEQTSRITLASSGMRNDGPPPIVTTMDIYSRAIVESQNSAGTVVLAITDSAVVRSNDDRMTLASLATAQRLRGQKTRVRVAPDGGITVLDDASGATRTLVEAVALMPATFPRTRVSVDDRWTRALAVPSGTSALGAPITGTVEAAFRFDSTARDGALAYVSVRGQLGRVGARKPGSSVVESGTIEGTLVVDRARGWLTESTVTVDARSSLVPVPGLSGPEKRFVVHVTQRVRVTEKRW